MPAWFEPSFSGTGDPTSENLSRLTPFLAQQFISGRLKLFELHPTDFKSLTGNIRPVGRQVTVAERAAVLSRSKPFCRRHRRMWCCVMATSDYGRVSDCMADAVSVCEHMWCGTHHPRTEAHDFAAQAQDYNCQGWTRAGSMPRLISSKSTNSRRTTRAKSYVRPAASSGMFIINPPHAEHLSLPQMARWPRDRSTGFTLDHGG
jgi:23S rRNA (adenine2030-N6)-methyltransferase